MSRGFKAMNRDDSADKQKSSDLSEVLEFLKNKQD